MEEHYSTVRRTAIGDGLVVMFAVEGRGIFTLSEGLGLEASGVEAGKMVSRSTFGACDEALDVAENVRRVLSGETFALVVEVEGTTFDCFYIPLRDGQGTVVGAIGVADGSGGRRRAEDALVESEERYRMLVENVQEGIGFVGPEGVVEYCNAAYAAILGLVPDGLVGRSFFEFLDREHREEALRQRGLRTQGASSSYELTVTTADGEEKVLSCGGYPVFGPAGSYEGAVQTIVDATERRRHEAALRKSEERYRLVAGAIKEAIWDSDLLTNEQVWDGAVEAIFGYPSGQVRDSAWWQERVHPDDRGRVLAKIGMAMTLAGPETWSDEYRFLRSDGTYATVYDRGYVVRDPSTGEAVRMLGSMADVTERRKAEEQLRDSEKRYRIAFDSAPVSMAHISPDGRFLRINDRFSQLSGYGRDELLGMTWQDVTPPEDLGVSLDRVRSLVDGKLGSYSVERRYVRKDGSRVWIELSVSVARRASGEPDYLICAADDITARKIADLVPNPLTRRELEVLRQIAAGRTNQQAAKNLSYSEGTVKLDVRNLLRKLEVKDRAEAVAKAVDIGLVPPRREPLGSGRHNRTRKLSG